MKRNFLLCSTLALLVGLFMFVPGAQSGTPINGLVVAISPDGKTLVAGGNTRTLLILDPVSLEVKRRVWVETTITSLAFSKNGETLVLGDTNGQAVLYKTSDWTKKIALDKRDKIACAQAGNLFAGIDAGWDGTGIYFHSLDDASLKGNVKLPKEQRVISFGLDPAGTKMAVLLAEKVDPAEKKVEYNDMPKDLDSSARAIFTQKNDGKTSTILFFEIPSGKKISENTIYYSSYDCKIFLNGGNAYLAGYSNGDAMVSPDGKVEGISLPNTGYGIAASADHKLLMTGSMKTLAFTSMNPITSVKAEVGPLPGWPEYLHGFAANATGPCYASTSAYRIARVTREGVVEKIVPTM